jgi:hypothetical protein
MSIAAREDVDRPGGSVPPAGDRRATPPISVVVGVVSFVAAVVWMRTMTPSIEPTLTVEFPDSSASLLFGVALVVGTLLGVRILWGLTLLFSVVPSALVLSTAIDDPRAQTVGGFLLLAVALVCLALPSTQRFEYRRIRLLLV